MWTPALPLLLWIGCACSVGGSGIIQGPVSNTDHGDDHAGPTQSTSEMHYDQQGTSPAQHPHPALHTAPRGRKQEKPIVPPVLEPPLLKFDPPDDLLIKWQEPEYPGGELEKYQLKITLVQGDGSVPEVITKNIDADVTHYSTKLPQSQYSCYQVCAIGMGRASPFSDKVCTAGLMQAPPQGLSFGSGVICGLAIAAVGATMAVVFRNRAKINHMRAGKGPYAHLNTSDTHEDISYTASMEDNKRNSAELEMQAADREDHEAQYAGAGGGPRNGEPPPPTWGSGSTTWQTPSLTPNPSIDPASFEQQWTTAAVHACAFSGLVPAIPPEEEVENVLASSHMICIAAGCVGNTHKSYFASQVLTTKEWFMLELVMNLDSNSVQGTFRCDGASLLKPLSQHFAQQLSRLLQTRISIHS